jgi:hypothetical protein
MVFTYREEVVNHSKETPNVTRGVTRTTREVVKRGLDAARMKPDATASRLWTMSTREDS